MFRRKTKAGCSQLWISACSRLQCGSWQSLVTAVKAAMTIVSRDFQEIVQPRVKSRRSSESLLLPPENFEGSSGPIREFFVELTRQTRSWADPYPDRELLRWFDS